MLSLYKCYGQGPSMITKRVSHMAVQIKSCIYIIGGWDGQGKLSLMMYFINFNRDEIYITLEKY